MHAQKALLKQTQASSPRQLLCRNVLQHLHEMQAQLVHAAFGALLAWLPQLEALRLARRHHTLAVRPQRPPLV